MVKYFSFCGALDTLLNSVVTNSDRRFINERTSVSSKTCSQAWMVINRVGMDPPTPACLCSNGCLKLKIMCMCVRYFYHLCDEIPG